ncbi:MAG: S1C family serine protease [Jatrophihabitantaceae bacterium]
MSEQPGREAVASQARLAAGPPEDDSYARPPGVESAFDRREQPPPYTPPPATVSPEERAAFAAPEQGVSFAPLDGERLPPRPMQVPPVPHVLTETFGASPEAVDGFAPAPGTRICATGSRAESPWWKADAHRDPWRDPDSPFWLGRGAIFSRGMPAQLEPDLDSETEEDFAPEPQPPAPAETAGSKRARLGLGTASIMVLVALLAGALGGGAGYWLANRASSLLHRGDVSLATADKPANRPPGSVAVIAKRVGPAVVSIAVTTPSEYAVGSGVVIDRNGYVLTNNHVIAAGTGPGSSIVVTFSDEATASARVVGRDPISDLAVLKVPTDQLTVATLGNSDQLAVGDPVIAIGSPLGLEGTVTAGIVSALGRAVHVFGDNGASDAYLEAVQTDAAINPGNSGGALVDAAGAVVGINSAGRFSTTDASGQQTPVSGIGYAIPINYARDIAAQLIKSGKAAHGALGAQGRTVTDGTREGAYLEQVTPGEAAAKAGLQNGDVVVVADKHAILSYDQLVVIVQTHRPGDSIELTYFRGSAEKHAKIILGSA